MKNIPKRMKNNPNILLSDNFPYANKCQIKIQKQYKYLVLQEQIYSYF